MSEYTCQIRNLSANALSGFIDEQDALAAGGRYLVPSQGTCMDLSGQAGLFIVCENCGAVMTQPPPAAPNTNLACDACGEEDFRVLQTFRLVKINSGFEIIWHPRKKTIEIIAPAWARQGIHYTLDGTKPTLISPLYSGPIECPTSKLRVRAIVFTQDTCSQMIEWSYTQRNKRASKPKPSPKPEQRPYPKPKPIIDSKPTRIPVPEPEPAPRPRPKPKPIIDSKPTRIPEPEPVPEPTSTPTTPTADGEGCGSWFWWLVGAWLFYEFVIR